jgi:hypothetical protein
VTLLNKHGVEQHFTAALNDQGVSFDKMLTVPVSAANLVWYGVAKDETGLHMGKYSRVDQRPIEFTYFPTNDSLLSGVNQELVDTLKWFSQDYYTVAEHDGKIRLYNMQCDMQGIRHFGD